MLILFGLSCKEEIKTIRSEKDFCHSYMIDSSDAQYLNLDFIKNIPHGKTGVFVLEEGEEAITSRAYLSQAAQKSMDVQYFIYSEDNVGTISCDYMLRAACNGVQIRLLVDDLMIDLNPDYILALSQHKNISIKIYNPNLNIGKNLPSKLFETMTDFRGINQRMHHKTFIIDQTVAITGGRNIADEYFDYDHEYNFRDRDVLLIGEVVNDMQIAFNEFWVHELSISIENIIQYSSPDVIPEDTYTFVQDYAKDSLNFWPEIRNQIPNSLSTILKSPNFYWVDSVAFVSDIPGKNESKDGLGGGGLTTDALIQLVNNAKEEVFIQSPYLIISDIGYGLFKNTADKGVKITILTNSLASTDNLEAFSGYQRNRYRLIEAGVQIYEYRPDAAIRKELMKGSLQRKLDFVPTFGLHAKTMVVDDSISVIGTFNLDPRSANLNTECITIIHDPRINSDIKDIINQEILPQNAWKVTKDYNPDKEAGFGKRMKAWSRKIVPTSIL
jgi:putative cardiolipin synthase